MIEEWFIQDEGAEANYGELICVGLSALGLLAIGYLGFRPRPVSGGPSALRTETRGI
jgi:hypothetical protein